MPNVWEWINRDAKLLILAIAFRGIVLGSLAVSFTVYLSKLGLEPVFVGAFLALTFLCGSVIGLAAGLSADRFGKKRVLIFLGILIVLANIVYTLTADVLLVYLTAFLGVMSSGGALGAVWGGSSGPVHQAFLADKVAPRRRNTLFGYNAFIVTLSSAGGAFISGLPSYLNYTFGASELDGFKTLFAILSFVALGNILALSYLREEHGERAARRPIPVGSKRLIKKMSVFSFAEGFANAMILPLLSYWFYLAYGADVGRLGLVFGGANALAAVTMLLAAKVADRLGAVKALLLLKAPAAILLIMLPLSPSFAVASAIHIIRSAIAQLYAPVWQSYVMGVFSKEERSSAAAITVVSWRSPGAFAPAISGYLIQFVSLSVPLILAGGLLLGPAILFYHFFKQIKPEEERDNPSKKTRT